MYYVDISINFLANPTFKRPPKALKVCRKAVTQTTVTISTIYTITRVDYAIYHRKSCFSLIMILNYNLAHFMTAHQIKRFLMIKKRHVGEAQLFQYEVKRHLLSSNEGQAP